MTFSTHELAWAAGFFDGEGHCAFRRSDRHVIKAGRVTYTATILDIRQVDRRALERFRNAVCVGNIYGPYRNSGAPRSRPYFAFAAGSFEHVQAIVAKLWRWLGPVKREQVMRMLTAKRDEPRRVVGRKPVFASRAVKP